MAESVNRRQLAWLVGILLAFSAASLLLLPTRESSGDIRASTFLTTEKGTRALFETMAELGLPVARRTTPFVDADPLRGTLVVLAPSAVALAPAERRALIAWVRTGGSLLVTPGIASSFDPLSHSLELGPHAPVIPVPFVRIAREPVTPAAHPWVAGIGPVPPAGSAFHGLPDDLEYEPLLLTEDSVPVALVYEFGRGTILALADQTLLSNETAGEQVGAAQAFVRAAVELTAPGDTIWFDEYHHGFSSGGGPVRALLEFARSSPAGRALVHLAFVSLGLLLLVSRRLGAPRPAPQPRRRSPLEHVDALARLYQQAGARRTARGLLVAGLARRLNDPHAVREGDIEPLLARLRRHPTRGPAADRLAALLTADAEPAAVAAAIDDVIDPEAPQ